jgi:hypothetical protein
MVIVVSEVRLPEAILFVAVPPAAPSNTMGEPVVGVLEKPVDQFPLAPLQVEVEEITV